MIKPHAIVSLITINAWLKHIILKLNGIPCFWGDVCLSDREHRIFTVILSREEMFSYKSVSLESYKSQSCVSGS
jgi:hypothetical protein